MKLTEKQQRIVDIEAYTQNPYIACLASAGSGKSTVVENRVAHLVLKKKVHPSKITLFSFSRAATKEIRDRLQVKLGNQLFQSLNVSTLHSFCYHVVRRHLNPGKETPINIFGQGQFFKLASSFIDNAEDEVSLCDPEAYVEEVESSAKNNRKPEFSGPYKALNRQVRNWMSENNLYLFDDLLKLTYNIFSTRPQLKLEYSQLYDYWFIDEAQDTTRVMIDIVELLIRPDLKLMMSFDIVQSLYQFAGADPFYLMAFIDRIGGEIMQLDETFRFGPTVAELADMVVSQIDIDKRYKMFTQTRQTSNPPIYVPVVATDIVRSKIAEDILWKVNNGTPLGDISILSRTNRPLLGFQKELARYGIPSKLKFGYLWDRKEIKMLLTVVRLFDQHNSEDLTYLTKNLAPSFGIDKKRARLMYSSYKSKSIIEFLQYFLENKVRGLGVAANNGIRLLLSYIERVAEIIEDAENSSTVFSEIAKALDFNDCDFMRDKTTEEGQNNREERWEFIEVLDTIRNEKEPDVFQVESMLRLEFTTEDEKDSDVVQLKTIHSSKGETLPHVYLLADTFNPKFMTDENSFRSELFVLYVAITRTRDELQIWGKLPPSFEFLEECEMESPDLEELAVAGVEQGMPSLAVQLLERPMIRENRVRRPIPLVNATPIRESAKAVMFEIEHPERGRVQQWLPKSQMTVIDDRLAVSQWLMTKNNLN